MLCHFVLLDRSNAQLQSDIMQISEELYTYSNTNKYLGDKNSEVDKVLSELTRLNVVRTKLWEKIQGNIRKEMRNYANSSNYALNITNTLKWLKGLPGLNSKQLLMGNPKQLIKEFIKFFQFQDQSIIELFVGDGSDCFSTILRNEYK